MRRARRVAASVTPKRLKTVHSLRTKLRKPLVLIEKATRFINTPHSLNIHMHSDTPHFSGHTTGQMWREDAEASSHLHAKKVNAPLHCRDATTIQAQNIFEAPTRGQLCAMSIPVGLCEHKCSRIAGVSANTQQYTGGCIKNRSFGDLCCGM